MTTEVSPTHVAASPRPAGRARRAPRIDWAHNPKDTSKKDLLWFLAIPVVMGLITLGVVLTALSTTAP